MELSEDSTGFLTTYVLLLGPHELFRVLGESMNFEFYAWSRSCCLGALALYWFASEKRKESFGMLSPELVGSMLDHLFRPCRALSTLLASMPLIMLFWWPIFLFVIVYMSIYVYVPKRAQKQLIKLMNCA